MISFKWEPRDLWIGAYVGDDALYICLIPTLVIEISWKVTHVGPLLEKMADRGEDMLKYESVICHCQRNGPLDSGHLRHKSCPVRYPNKPEPPPEPNDSTPIWSLVIADMKERDRIGRKKYGTPLQAHNGRDALVDAYQEILDAAVYLCQAIVERGCPACASEGGEPCIDHVRL